MLGVAKAHFRPLELPPEQHDFVFDFLGLIGLVDPVRSTVADAVKECYSAGIRVIMITGDYPDTARSIAERIGLAPRDEIITGPELERIDDRTLQQRIKTVCIFARTMPEQKLRLVQALKANGEVVAMTGDGVNDAPAMKAADIGVAMENAVQTLPAKRRHSSCSMMIFLPLWAPCVSGGGFTTT